MIKEKSCLTIDPELTNADEDMNMNKCHELMNEGLDSHRTKTNEGIQYAIQKYQDALNNVPENGILSYPDSGYHVRGGNNIRSEIWTHIGYAYHDLGNPFKAKNAYDTALRYNPYNQDAKHDRTLPHGLRARRNNEGQSGIQVKYVENESLCQVIITDNQERPNSQDLPRMSWDM